MKSIIFILSALLSLWASMADARSDVGAATSTGVRLLTIVHPPSHPGHIILSTSIVFSDDLNPGSDLTAKSTWTGSISCSGGFEADQKHQEPLSMFRETEAYDTCARLKEWQYADPNFPTQARQQYDSLRLYIEHCAVLDPTSWQAFQSINASVQRYSADTSRFTEYRNWLISVIYLNTINPEYFCACLGSIMGTYQFYPNYPAILCGLSVLDFARHDSNCYDPALDELFTQDSSDAVQYGYDATHLPTLDDLGLGFLLTRDVKQPSLPLAATYLGVFRSSPNPFSQATELSFVLNRMSYTTIAIYDELGRKVWGDDHGRSLDTGAHTIHIDGSSLPSGTLYARISTGFGEVKTVKLVKQ